MEKLIGLGPRRLSRRSMLRGVGMAGVAAALTACGDKGAAAAANTVGGGSSTGDADRVLTWSNWPEYIDTDDRGKHATIEQFETATGIKVTYVEDINDHDEYLAKVQPLLAAGQPIPADVFIVTDWMVTKLIRLGYLERVDHATIPNLKNLTPELQHVGYDPERTYSVPWESGFAGIAYNPNVTNGPIESIDRMLTDPALKGKVALLTEMQDTVGLTLLDLGYDCSDFTDEQFGKAIAKLQKAVDAGQIRQFLGNDYAQGLVSGDIAACMAWTGDVVQLQLDNPNLAYVLPDAGCTYWSDNFVIPKGARHKKAAEQLINFYYDPAIAAQVADYVNYIPPVVGTRDVLLENDPAVADNPLIFPPGDVMKRAHVFMALDEEREKRYSAAFARLTGS